MDLVELELQPEDQMMVAKVDLERRLPPEYVDANFRQHRRDSPEKSAVVHKVRR